MPVSIIEVDVKDEKFQTFVSTFQKYQKALKDSPDLWKGVDGAIGGAAETGLTLAAAIFAQAEAAKAVAAAAKVQADAQRKAAKDAKDQEFSWNKVASSAKSFASSVGSAVGTLIKWSSITTIGAGLAGAGGLFGLDELAGGVSAGRRSSLGQNVSYGAQKAFGVDYGRLVDPGSVLAGVNDALTDVSKRYALYGAGLRESDIAGKNTGQVAQALLPAVEALVDRTPREFLATLQQSRNLGLLGLSVDDLQRIKDTPAGERAQLAKAFGLDQGAFGLSADTQKKYQDFSTQLSRSGAIIETAFVRGIVPLLPGLTTLSGSVAKAVTTLLGSLGPNGEALKGLGDGIENLAKYIGGKQFQDDLKTFTTDIGLVAGALVNGLRLLGVIPGPKAPNPFAPSGVLLNRTEAGDSFLYKLGSYFGRPNPTNPGNIRDPATGRFKVFGGGPAEGIQAIGAQLLRYEYAKKWGGLDTIAKIVSTYAPASDHNDVAAYIKDVSTRTGIGANQHLDLHNQSTLAKLVAAITKHENKKNNYSPQMVLKILNNTGGNVTLQTAAAAVGQ